MRLDRASVQHVAGLAHIALDDAEIDRLAVELSSVIDHVAKLSELDTENVQATAHTIPLENVMREDEVRPSWPVEAVLANSPARSGDLFEVGAVLD